MVWNYKYYNYYNIKYWISYDSMILIFNKVALERRCNKILLRCSITCSPLEKIQNLNNLQWIWGNIKLVWPVHKWSHQPQLTELSKCCYNKQSLIIKFSTGIAQEKEPYHLCFKSKQLAIIPKKKKKQPTSTRNSEFNLRSTINRRELWINFWVIWWLLDYQILIFCEQALMIIRIWQKSVRNVDLLGTRLNRKWLI